MFDVLHLQQKRGCRVIGTGLEREAAARIARDEADRLRVSRMFLAGSASVPRGESVVIVRTGASARV